MARWYECNTCGNKIGHQEISYCYVSGQKILYRKCIDCADKPEYELKNNVKRLSDFDFYY